MPELPEVETIRRDLLPLVQGRKIVSAWVSENAPRLVQLLTPQEFERSLPGHTIEDVSRRGKYLVFNLSGGMLWVVHLRMTGRLQHQWVGCAGTDPYNRASFGLDDETWLCFNDLRKFGMMWFVDDWSLVKRDIGPEPLEDGFSRAPLSTGDEPQSSRCPPRKEVSSSHGGSSSYSGTTGATGGDSLALAAAASSLDSRRHAIRPRTCLATYASSASSSASIMFVHHWAVSPAARSLFAADGKSMTCAGFFRRLAVVATSLASVLWASSIRLSRDEKCATNAADLESGACDGVTTARPPRSMWIRADSAQ
jgi:hypothetical protein